MYFAPSGRAKLAMFCMAIRFVFFVLLLFGTLFGVNKRYFRNPPQWIPTPHLKNGKRLCFFLFFGYLVLGLASGLEAFSRKPPCDGVGALAVRQTPETRGTAWEFLSYYPILPSRYLRDPLNNLVKGFLFFNQFFFKTHLPSTVCFGKPKTALLRFARIFSRNSQLSRVKPTCLTTV